MKRLGPALTLMLPVLTLIVGLMASTVSQAADDLDVTMRMVLDDSDLTNSVVQEIELPRAVPSVPSTGRDNANERAVKGMDQRDAAHAAARDARNVTGRKDSIERPEDARPDDAIEARRDAQQDLSQDRPDASANRPQTPTL
ncbi:hypothetical protein [Marinobacter sp. F4216]|uniref:hypothetical protein n=1 Tax=Marinobacter sp. F4216 TaxID=2874281 RepID=UPI001CC17B33|nr:hypothetical protein [Marinobacter sp. F4216]MBZ2170413.1 hypothetical protein [Marinobacter sp. F4216]